MGAGHAPVLVVPGPSPVHGLRPHTKTVATVAFVVAVVSTPREAVWAYGLHAAVLAGVATAGRVPAAVVTRRLAVLVPFVAFALALPFVAEGERIHVVGLGLSREGCWAAWNVVVKAVLGLGATVVLVATTPLGDLLRGLERLRVPPIFTAVGTFMLRYLEVVGAELRRMQVARASRGHDPRWLWQARAVAATAGALFVRTYERGERVHLAMVSRGYDGTLRALATPAATAAEWVAVLALPAAAATVSVAAWSLR